MSKLFLIFLMSLPFVAAGTYVSLEDTDVMPDRRNEVVVGPPLLMTDVSQCGGVGIEGTNLLLTAGHCVDGATTARVWVDNVEVPVKRWLLHPSYSDDISAYHADVAIVELEHRFRAGPWSGELSDEVTFDNEYRASGWDVAESGPAELLECSVQFRDVLELRDYTEVPCSLPQGTSGSGLLTGDVGNSRIRGVLSTTNTTTGANRFVPERSLVEIVELHAESM